MITEQCTPMQCRTGQGYVFRCASISSTYPSQSVCPSHFRISILSASLSDHKTVDKLAMEVNMMADMVADLEVDMVAEMEVDQVADNGGRHGGGHDG